MNKCAFFIINKCYFKIYSSNPYFLGGAYFGEGGDTQRVWLDDLSCNGTEDDIGKCQSRGWGVSQCGHSQDVSVICGMLRFLTTLKRRQGNKNM